MGVKICPSCGGKVAESRNDCMHCGYVFNKQRKCPECESLVDENVSECPICGHVFAKPIEEKVKVEKKNNIEKKVNKSLECPYCHGKELMMIGNDYHMCMTCKGKFLSDGLVSQDPNHIYVPKKKAESAETDFKEEKSTSKSESNENVQVKGPFWLYVFSISLLLGIVVNMIVAKAVWGYLRAMYVYPLYGYIAGFCISGTALIFIPFFFVAEIKKNKLTHNKSHLMAVIMSTIMIIATAALYLISAMKTVRYYLASFATDNGDVYGLTSCREFYYDYREVSKGHIAIPKRYDGHKIEIIGRDAFANCDGLYSVIVPDTVYKIESEAFRDCYSLRRIYIPESVKYIEYGAFDGCQNLVIYYAGSSKPSGFESDQSRYSWDYNDDYKDYLDYVYFNIRIFYNCPKPTGEDWQ